MTASRMADRFNLRARPRLWAEHAEVVDVQDFDAVGTPTTATLQGVFRRVRANGVTRPDGIGAQTYTGEATMVVDQTVFSALALTIDAILVRNGEKWRVRQVEPLDAQTFTLWLARPDEQTVPGGR